MTFPDDDAPSAQNSKRGTVRIGKGTGQFERGTRTSAAGTARYQRQMEDGDVGWLVFALATATLPFIPDLPVWLIMMMGLMAAYRWWRGQHGKGAAPRRARLMATAFLVAGLGLHGHLAFGLEGALPLFIGLLWLKLLEVDRQRDVLMTCFLCWFLIAVGLLTEQNLLRALYTGIGLVAITATALRLHCRGSLPVFVLGQRASALIAQSLPLAAVMFLLLPRPNVRIDPSSVAASTGISDALRPADIAHLARSQEPAFRVEFAAAGVPAIGDCYWRGLTLWETSDGMEWNHGPHVLRSDNIGQPFPVIAERNHRQLTYDIVLPPHNRNWLYALDCPLRGPADATGFAGLELIVDQPVTRAIAYTVTSRLDAHADDASAKWLAKAIDKPSTSSRVIALANTWRDLARGRAGEIAADRVVQQALAFFRDNSFAYTLDPGRLGRDPLDEFLFDRRQGFCGHYAAAFASLMRLAGVPARVVVGYRGGEFNEPGEFVLVRQSNAHAWTEVWMGRTHGWLRVDPVDTLTNATDPAAAAVLDARHEINTMTLDQGWWSRHLRTVRQYWDFADARWDHWVLAYDRSGRDRLLDRLRQLVAEMWSLLAPFLRVAAMAAVVAGAGIPFLWLRRRAGDDSQRLWRRYCRLLHRHGIHPAAWEGPLALAERAEAAWPERVDAIRAAAAAYADLRYGAPPAAKTARGRMKSALRALARQRR